MINWFKSFLKFLNFPTKILLVFFLLLLVFFLLFFVFFVKVKVNEKVFLCPNLLYELYFVIFLVDFLILSPSILFSFQILFIKNQLTYSQQFVLDRHTKPNLYAKTFLSTIFSYFYNSMQYLLIAILIIAGCLYDDNCESDLLWQIHKLFWNFSLL